MEHIIDRVAQKQMPQQRPDGSFHPGVMDENMGNTDQVPVYIEDHIKVTWGMREDHIRRTVGTAGKEKDSFTDQLAVFKDGTKVCRVSFSTKLSVSTPSIVVESPTTKSSLR